MIDRDILERERERDANRVLSRVYSSCVQSSCGERGIKCSKWVPAALRALQNSWPRDRSTRVVFVCVCVWRWKISGYFRTRTNKRKPPPFASIFFFASFASFYSKTHAAAVAGGYAPAGGCCTLFANTLEGSALTHSQQSTHNAHTHRHTEQATRLPVELRSTR